jgi:hypothetical protein
MLSANLPRLEHLLCHDHIISLYATSTTMLMDRIKQAPGIMLLLYPLNVKHHSA